MKNKLKTFLISGYCTTLGAGIINVRVHVDDCVGTATGDAASGWNSASRIIVKEVPKSPYSWYINSWKSAAFVNVWPSPFGSSSDDMSAQTFQLSAYNCIKLSTNKPSIGAVVSEIPGGGHSILGFASGSIKKTPLFWPAVTERSLFLQSDLVFPLFLTQRPPPPQFSNFAETGGNFSNLFSKISWNFENLCEILTNTVKFCEIANILWKKDPSFGRLSPKDPLF